MGIDRVPRSIGSIGFTHISALGASCSESECECGGDSKGTDHPQHSMKEKMINEETKRKEGAID